MVAKIYSLCQKAGCNLTYYNIIMASHMKIKLPSIKLTQRSTHEPVKHRTIPRGMAETSKSSMVDSTSVMDPAVHVDDGNDPDYDEMGTEFSGSDCQDKEQPSLHYIKQKAATTAWQQNRILMLKAHICHA